MEVICAEINKDYLLILEKQYSYGPTKEFDVFKVFLIQKSAIKTPFRKIDLKDLIDEILLITASQQNIYIAEYAKKFIQERSNG